MFSKRFLLFFLLGSAKFIFSFNSQNNIEYQIKIIPKKLFKKSISFYKSNQQDSALYFFVKSKEGYLIIKDSVNIAKCYNNIAKIFLENNDLIGSEQNTIDALRYYKKDIIGRFKSHNRLGIISKKKGLLIESIKNYQNAFNLIEPYKSYKHLEIASLNNIGNAYRIMSDYSQAISFFNKALKYDSIAIKHPKKYARLIDNKAYANILSGKTTSNFLELLLESLSIRKKINDTSGIIICNIHIADYYKKKGLLKKALPFVKEALALARTTNNDDFIESLIAIAEIDIKNASIYFKEYIELNDKLLLRERSFKNTSAKIKYETEKKEQENSKLKNEVIDQKKTTILLFIALGGSFLLFLGGVFLFRERQKSQKQRLIIEKLQAKENERNRLAGNVHDSLAGYLRTAMTRVDNLNKELKSNKLEEVGDTIELAYNKARNISKEFQKLNFKKVSFEKHIKNLLFERQELYKTTIDDIGMHTIDWKIINTEIKTEFYRILQEALLNINKHAAAKNVTVTFDLDKNNIKMDIKDDGLGMDISESFESVGLSNMQARIKDLNGKMKVDSSPNNGFELMISVPV